MVFWRHWDRLSRRGESLPLYEETWGPSADTEAGLKDSPTPFATGVCLPTAPRIPWILPRTTYYRQLEELFLLAGNHEKEQIRIQLVGPEGIGKTQLAIGFARSHLSEFQSIFFVNGRSWATVVQSCVANLDQIFMSAIRVTKGRRQPYRGEDSVGAFSEWLSHPFNRDWLLIWDGVEDGARRNYNILEFLPSAKHGRIIFTSRTNFLYSLEPSITVEKLEHSEAENLLEGTLSCQLPSFEQCATKHNQCEQVLEEAKVQLLENLDRHPASISLAARCINLSGMNIDRFNSRLSDTGADMITSAITYLHAGQDPEGEKFKTWCAALEELQDNAHPDPAEVGRTKNAARMLTFFAYFNPRRLSYEFFRRGLFAVVVPAWFRETLASKTAMMWTVEPLVRRGLLASTDTAGEFVMDPLYHDFCRDWAEVVEGHENLALAVAVMGNNTVSKWHPNTYPISRAVVEHVPMLIPHIKPGIGVDISAEDWTVEGELAQREFRYGPCNVEATEVRHAGVDLADLLLEEDKLDEVRVLLEAMLRPAFERGEKSAEALLVSDMYGYFLSRSHKWGEAQEFLENAIEGFDGIFGEKAVMSLMARQAMADISYEQERYSYRLTLQTEILEKAEGTWSETSCRRQSHLSTMGSTYKRLGKMEKAIEYKAKTSEVLEGLHGIEHPSVLYSLSRLATLWDGVEGFDKAKILGVRRKVVDACISLYGLAHGDTADEINSLAEMLEADGPSDEALEMRERVVDALGKIEVKGNDRYWLGMARAQLAGAYLVREKEDDAMAEISKTVALVKANPDSEDNIYIIREINRVLQEQSRLDQAVAVTKDCLQHVRNTLKPWSSGILEFLGEMSEICNRDSKWEAEQCAADEELIELGLILTGNTPMSTMARATLADVLDTHYRQGRWTEDLLKLSHIVQESYEWYYGDQSPKVLSSLLIVGQIARCMRRWEEASSALQRVARWADSEDAVEFFPSTIDGVWELALLANDIGDYKEADRLNAKTLKLYKKHVEACRILHMLGRIGSMYVDRREYGKAIEVLPEVLDMGPFDMLHHRRDRLHSIFLLAYSHRAEGQLEEAERVGKTALPEMEEALGPGDSDTIRLRFFLCQVSWRCGKYEQVVPNMLKQLQISTGHNNKPPMLHPRVLGELALAHMCLGDADLAKTFIEEAVGVLTVQHGDTAWRTRAAKATLQDFEVIEAWMKEDGPRPRYILPDGWKFAFDEDHDIQLITPRGHDSLRWSFYGGPDSTFPDLLLPGGDADGDPAQRDANASPPAVWEPGSPLAETGRETIGAGQEEEDNGPPGRTTTDNTPAQGVPEDSIFPILAENTGAGGDSAIIESEADGAQAPGGPGVATAGETPGVDTEGASQADPPPNAAAL